MRKSPLISMILVMLAVCGFGAGRSGSGNHSVADVKSAMHAVGLSGFKPISKASMRRDKPTPGIKPGQIDGAFSYVHLGTKGQAASVVSVVLAVVNDRHVIPIMERDVEKESAGTPTLHFSDFQADNVVILTGSENVDATGRRTLARIHKLVSYLKAH
jgi:hypothetical protein